MLLSCVKLSNRIDAKKNLWTNCTIKQMAINVNLIMSGLLFRMDRINDQRKFEVKLFYVVVIACSMLLTGCVFNMTQSELRSKTRQTLFESVKSSRVIAPCIAGEWKKTATFMQEVQSQPECVNDFETPSWFI